MGRKKWETKMGSKEFQVKRSHLPKKTGKKKWEANKSTTKTGILNGTEKMGSKEIKKKGGILNGTEKKVHLSERSSILQTSSPFLAHRSRRF